MWMLTRYGNYSAVYKGGNVQVRARVRDDLKRLIEKGFVPKGTKIIETADGMSDYRYRILINHDQWASACEALARDIDYGNFKSEVMKSLGPKREGPLHSIWSILAKLQPGGAYARDKKHRRSTSQSKGGSGWQSEVYGGAKVDEVWIDELVDDRDQELATAAEIEDTWLTARLGEAFTDEEQLEMVSEARTSSEASATKRKRKRGGR